MQLAAATTIATQQQYQHTAQIGSETATCCSLLPSRKTSCFRHSNTSDCSAKKRRKPKKYARICSTFVGGAINLNAIALRAHRTNERIRSGKEFRDFR